MRHRPSRVGLLFAALSAFSLLGGIAGSATVRRAAAAEVSSESGSVGTESTVSITVSKPDDDINLVTGVGQGQTVEANGGDPVGGVWTWSSEPSSSQFVPNGEFSDTFGSSSTFTGNQPVAYTISVEYEGTYGTAQDTGGEVLVIEADLVADDVADPRAVPGRRRPPPPRADRRRGADAARVQESDPQRLR